MKCEVKIHYHAESLIIGYLLCLKIPPSSDVINSDFAKEKPGNGHLTKELKLAPPQHHKSTACALSQDAQRKTRAFPSIPVKIVQLESNHRETSDKVK